MHRSVIDYTPGLVDLGLSGVKEYTDSAENHPLHAITPLSPSDSEDPTRQTNKEGVTWYAESTQMAASLYKHKQR